jgi:hypothetical protein
VITPQRRIDVAAIGSSIEQLQEHFGEDDVAPLVAVLEAMKRNPQDSALMDQLSKVFDGLGIMQGAVLTYAPYLAVILSDSSFDDPSL